MSVLNHSADDAECFQQDALDWFVRRRDSGWRADDENRFQTWLKADVRHASAYAQCADQWQQLGAMPADLVARMRTRLAQDKAFEVAVAQPSRRQFLVWPTASAIVATASGMGYMVWQELQQPTSVQTFRTERGQQQVVSLSDGSRLQLDTQTQVTVHFFRQRREVQLLDGQVVFEVQPDGRPFHVLAGATRVTVVGTRFAVRYTPEVVGNTHVQVAVEEGHVRVAQLLATEVEQGNYDLQAGVLLTMGQQVSSDPQGVVQAVTPIPADAIAPWRDRRVNFVDVPLLQALAELERYGTTGLRISDPNVATIRLSGSFDPIALTDLYKALPRVLPVRLQERPGFTEVVSAH